MDDSYASGLIAFPGGGQTGGTKLGATTNRFTTVATTADSCQLPQASGGLRYYVTNAGANSMNVFPFLGDAINALSANTAFAVASGKSAIFMCAVTGVWNTVLSA